MVFVYPFFAFRFPQTLKGPGKFIRRYAAIQLSESPHALGFLAGCCPFKTLENAHLADYVLNISELDLQNSTPATLFNGFQ